MIVTSNYHSLFTIYLRIKLVAKILILYLMFKMKNETNNARPIYEHIRIYVQMSAFQQHTITHGRRIPHTNIYTHTHKHTHTQTHTHIHTHTQRGQRRLTAIGNIQI